MSVQLFKEVVTPQINEFVAPSGKTAHIAFDLNVSTRAWMSSETLVAVR